MNLRLRAATSEDHAFLRELDRLAYEDVVTRQFSVWDDSAQQHRFDSAPVTHHAAAAAGRSGEAPAVPSAADPPPR